MAFPHRTSSFDWPRADIALDSKDCYTLHHFQICPQATIFSWLSLTQIQNHLGLSRHLLLFCLLESQLGRYFTSSTQTGVLEIPVNSHPAASCISTMQAAWVRKGWNCHGKTRDWDLQHPHRVFSMHGTTRHHHQVIPFFLLGIWGSISIKFAKTEH